MEIRLRDGECAEELFAGKIIIQNEGLYRFTSDSILLSRFARAKKGDAVADFCAGCGAVGFHFLCLNPHIKSLTLFELQPPLADMARRTAEYDGFDADVVVGRVQDIGAEYNSRFTLILCNPPYERGGLGNAVYEKAICRKEITITMREVVSVAAKKLQFGGRLAMVNRADRLAETLYTMKEYGLEPKRLQLIRGTAGSAPYAFMAEAVKGGKPSLEFEPDIVNTAQNGGRTGE